MRRTRTQAETIKYIEYIERFYSVAGAKQNTFNLVARHVIQRRMVFSFFFFFDVSWWPSYRFWEILYHVT